MPLWEVQQRKKKGKGKQAIQVFNKKFERMCMGQIVKGNGYFIRKKNIKDNLVNQMVNNLIKTIFVYSPPSLFSLYLLLLQQRKL